MNRMGTILLAGCLGLCAAVPSGAVDAKPKVQATTPAATDTAKAVPHHKKPTKSSLIEKLKRDLKSQQKSDTTKKYDNLIDANKDGVDDRVGKSRTRESNTPAVEVKAADTSGAQPTPKPKHR